MPQIAKWYGTLAKEVNIRNKVLEADYAAEYVYHDPHKKGVEKRINCSISVSMLV